MEFFSVFITQGRIHQIPYSLSGYIDADFHDHATNYGSCQWIHEGKPLSSSNNSDQSGNRRNSIAPVVPSVGN